jgi:ubiquinone/menaquinone biosynthesis C-methylase UbiE
MNSDTISALHCPTCGSKLKIEDRIEVVQDNILYGIVTCDCYRYPIVEGILVLRSEGISNWVVNALKRRDLSGALLILTRWDTLLASYLFYKNPKPSIAKALKTLAKLSSKKHVLDAKNYSFRQLIEKLGLGSFGIYLTHRLSAHTFWNNYALLPLIKENYPNYSLLDYGCGAGHSSFVHSHFASKIIGVDSSFWVLLLAQKNCPTSQLICSDGFSPLPFENQTFDVVLGLDCFHYVKSKVTLGNEFQRVVKPQGAILLPHLHNALKYNRSAGKHLSAASYSNIFNQTGAKLFPEEILLKSYLNENTVDLQKTYSAEDLDSFSSFTLVASKNNQIFQTYLDPKRYFLSMNESLTLNPLYKKTLSGDQFLLQRINPYPEFMKEFYLTEKILPQTEKIDKNKIDDLTKQPVSLNPELTKLMESFVIINLPPNY